MSSSPVRLIAEAGLNPVNFEDAKRYVDAAAEAEAYAIKFQYANPRFMVVGSQAKATKNLPFLSMASLYELKEYAKEKGLLFSITPHDFTDETLAFVCDVSDYVKVASPDMADYFLMNQLRRFNPRGLIISTGMSTGIEISSAMRVWGDMFEDIELVPMHCVSSYPAKLEDFNLAFMQRYPQLCDVSQYGFSDHASQEDVLSGALAVAAGATWVERHFCIEWNEDLPDQAVSMPAKSLKTYRETMDEVYNEPGDRFMWFLKMGLYNQAEIAKIEGEAFRKILDCEQGLRRQTMRVLMTARDVEADERVCNDYGPSVIPVRGDLDDEEVGHDALLSRDWLYWRHHRFNRAIPKHTVLHRTDVRW